ncbi:MAG: UbiX family flavin prenyltransferase [Firmicutes bacterium]|nr:UbiX family flavin prenyltransferase [Bacillota bacterium]
MEGEGSRRLVVAITGASGAILGIRLLEAARELGLETHLVVSEWAERTIQHETDYRVEDVLGLASVVHRRDDQAATISSGSFPTRGMAVVPCSMKTLAAIACGFADDLIHRAADVTLKERRKLVLVPREAPLSSIHLENMLKLSNLGAVILPPVPAFYTHPRSLDEVVDHVVARVLDQFGWSWGRARRWDGRMQRATE